MVDKLSIPPKDGLIIPTHHSASDWDKPGSGWRITTSYYVSPPSSLTLEGWQYVSQVLLCKASGTTRLPEGKLVTSFRQETVNGRFYPLFRNKAAIGVANIANCYVAEFKPISTTWQCRERVNNSYTRSWPGTKTSHPYNDWHKYRLTWGLLAWDLTVLLEYWSGSEWVQQGDIITIPDPLFGEEEIQRIGYWFYNDDEDAYNCIDDTEVWEITA